ncbi:MAG: XisI protein [Candidatus Thiothrix singaporensis]|uniref:XisI protein n=1 Tax=Candidatus Thiothrix singaporensis TaxID=2799669 RepID=A0A7L6ARS0_9GAMM|nr:MAG: XisI protein [Candidatus Thiothrix singaporensis]
MVTQLDYPALIKRILLEYTKYKPVYGDIETTVSFDDEHANYALLQAGWDGDDYLHGAIIHIRLIDGKIWIQYDGTEEGVATELLDAGVPKKHIVLGFRHPSERKYTGLAVA